MKPSETRGVWVFIEQRHGELQKVSLELLGKGRELADKLEQELVGVLLGDRVEGLTRELLFHGADRVLLAEHECLEPFVNEPYAKVLAELIQERKPEIVLIGATALGRDLAPRVSARVKTGLTADCTSLDIDPESRMLLMTRPAFGGNLLATIICPEHRPQMSTVRPGVMQKLERDPSHRGVVEKITPSLSLADLNVEVLEEVRETEKKIRIEEASVLVSGGRGLGHKENLQLIERLAEALGGEVSASRALVDAGWIERERQVGQTGKTVRPSLYFACGISGAIQHVAGMEGAEFIVAINKNNDAPIFEVSDVGIVGDVTKVVPALIEELQTLRND